MGFKEDTEFARFLSMGVVGTAAVAAHLRDDHGHAPIELERYAMSNKLWTTKVKRLRLPDLVCVRCGLRVESRAKSKLAVMLSDSDTEGRQWHAGGLRDGDLFAFVRVDAGQTPPRPGRPAFFTLAALRDAVDAAKRTSRKSASQGAEISIEWPSWVPSFSGRLVGFRRPDGLVVTTAEPDADPFTERSTGQRRAYTRWRRWDRRAVYLRPGDVFEAGNDIIAGAVAGPPPLRCPGATWDFAAGLGDDSDDISRYAVIKSAGALRRDDLTAGLRRIAEDDSADWRLRIEAFGSLAQVGEADPVGALLATARSDPWAERRIEAVFILSEVDTDEATDALAGVAGSDAPEEVRAAAIWGLGRGVRPRPEFVIPYVADASDLVALHAVVAPESLTVRTEEALAGLLTVDDRSAASAAEMLARHAAIGTLATAVAGGGRGRLWALRALGRVPADVVRERLGSDLNAELAAVLAPLWIEQDDWLRGEAADGIVALDTQSIRVDPLKP